MAGVWSLSFSCPICSEDYTESGDHVAKLLPCTHTVCRHCLENKLFQYFEKGLTCPVCNIKHHYGEGVDSVSENQYIQVMIRKDLKEVCRIHDIELSLFCEEPECQIPICGLCLKDEHKGHDFDGLQKSKEKRSKMLKEEIESFRKSCTSNKVKIVALRKINDREYKACREQMKRAREEAIKQVHETFDKLEAEVKEKGSKANVSINDTDTKIQDYMKQIQKMEETMGEMEIKALSEKLRAVKNVKTEMTNLMSQLNPCTYFELIAEKPSVITFNDFFGNLTQEEQDTQRNICHHESTEVRQAESPVPKRKREDSCSSSGTKQATRFECEVWKSHSTSFGNIHSICLLSDNTIILCGQEAVENGNGGWKLLRYNAQTGEELYNRTMGDHGPGGLTEVTMNSRQFLVLTWPTTIQFYDLDNLDQVAVTCTKEDPNTYFCTICTSSPSTLWYASWSLEAGPVELVQLNCTSTPRVADRIKISPCDIGRLVNMCFMEVKSNHSSSPPQLIQIPKYKININGNGSLDMCFVEDGYKMLLIVAQPATGLIAYNAKTGKVQWAVAGRLKDEKIWPKLPDHKVGKFTLIDGNMLVFTAVTTDDQGHIFASDLFNECVHVFSVDGRYLDVLLGKGRGLNLWKPRKVRWCKNTSSLVVSHKKDQNEMITFVKVK